MLSGTCAGTQPAGCPGCYLPIAADPGGRSCMEVCLPLLVPELPAQIGEAAGYCISAETYESISDFGEAGGL